MDKGLNFVINETNKIFAKARKELIILDRHHEDKDEDQLLKEHGFLWRSLITEFHKESGQPVVNDFRKDQLNELLELERELAFREKEK